MEEDMRKKPFKMHGEITNLIDLDKFLKNTDVTENRMYTSNISKACKDFPCVLGIDEAGRGPVLGPMVYGAAFCPINEAIFLSTLECADSKVLTEEKREEIFEKICSSSKVLGWIVEVISPTTICNSMLQRSKHSLNAVSMDSAVNLIRTAEKGGVNISQIFVDTVGKPEPYQKYLSGLFPNYKITVAKKADATYPIVSAASICAKVTRDHALKTWVCTENEEINIEKYGSGYPGDPTTKKFLEQNCDLVFGYPQLVRFSWSTASTALEKAAYLVEWEEADTDSPPTPPKNTSITSFFKFANPTSMKKTQHEFFTQRHLSRDVSL